MIELVYPSGPAPLMPGCKAGSAAEMLPIVDQSAQVIAQAPRDYCHSPARPLHPTVHLHIINRYGGIYLQQRAATKDLLPLYWDTAVGGHVSYGEYLVEALHREAAEELHLFEFNPVHLLSYVFEYEKEREFVTVFATVGDFRPEPDPDELAGGRYWSHEEIMANIGKGILTPNFEGEYPRICKSLQSLL